MNDNVYLILPIKNWLLDSVPADSREFAPYKYLIIKSNIALASLRS